MIEKSFKAKTENLRLVLGFLESELEKQGCNVKTSTALAIAVEELFVNVCLYAYPGSEGDISLKLDFVDNNVCIALIDSGIPFDPSSKEDPDITLSADERQIGGLGIYMAKKYTDEMIYERKDNKNILLIKKGIKN